MLEIMPLPQAFTIKALTNVKGVKGEKKTPASEGKWIYSSAYSSGI